MSGDEDRRRDRLVTIPNALGAVSIALLVFILTTLLSLTNRVASLEMEQAHIVEWQNTYQESPWNTGHNVLRWINMQEQRLLLHEGRLDKLEKSHARQDRLGTD